MNRTGLGFMFGVVLATGCFDDAEIVSRGTTDGASLGTGGDTDAANERPSDDSGSRGRSESGASEPESASTPTRAPTTPATSVAVVFPGQDEWFVQPIPGTDSFDYNCDAVEQRRYPDPGSSQDCVSCSATGNVLGWVGGVADCGEVRTVLNQCIPQPTSLCEPIYVDAVQPCR